MKYKERQTHRSFLPWQPSTWPAAPARVEDFITVLRKVFNESMLDELRNVVEDVKKSNGDLGHRGHVVAIALMCALDAVSSYSYRREHIAKFVNNHFPPEYRPHANDIYGMYRNSLIHSWNLFGATLLPGSEGIRKTDHTLSFGILNFLSAFQSGVDDFLRKLETDVHLQLNTRNRYERLRTTAKP